jgi:hypothetical protein
VIAQGGVGTGIEELLAFLRVQIPSRPVQRGFPTHINGVHLGPIRKKESDPLVKTRASGHVQQGATITLDFSLTRIELKKLSKQFEGGAFLVGFSPQHRDAIFHGAAPSPEPGSQFD